MQASFRFKNTDPLVPFSFSAGAMLNCLKLSSTLTLVSKVESDQFIILLLIATAFLILTSRLIGWFENRFQKRYLAICLTFPVITLSLDYFIFNGTESFSTTVFQYLITILAISMIEEALKLFQTKCLSPLAPESEKERIGISEEIGHLVGTLLLLLLSTPYSALMIGSLSSVAMVYLLPNLLIRLTFFSGASQVKLPASSTNQSLARLLLIFLFGLGLIKMSYSLLLYEGYQQLKNESLAPKEIFLYVSLAQGVLIIFLLFARSRMRFLSHWMSKAFVYLWMQILFLLVGTIFASPWMLISAASLRKSLNHSLLNFGLLELFLQLPSSIIASVKRRAELFSHIIGMCLLGLMAYIYYKHLQSNTTMTLFIVLECILVSFTLLALKRRLVDFHLEAIHSADPGQALASSYGLRVYSPQKAIKPLIDLMKSTRSTHLKRSIIHTLSVYRNSEVAEAILSEFNRQDREDMKVTCIQSLQAIGDDKIRLRLLEDLELIPLEQQSFEQFRWRLYLSISSSEFQEAKKRLLRLIDQEKKDPESRALSNFILILREIARAMGEDLSGQFKEFLNPPYSRRIRTNAAAGLYLTEPKNTVLLKLLEELRNSTDSWDVNAWVFFQGEVQNINAMSEIAMMSMTSNHQNPSILMTLLKLGHPEAPAWLAQYFQGVTQDSAISLIHSLNSVMAQESRLRFYKHIIGHYPEVIGKLLTCITYSKRDFGDDFQKILLELRFRGIDTLPFAKVARFGHYR